MKIEKVRTLCFSATGNTDRMVTLLGKELAAGLGVPLEQIAFTRPAEREQVYAFTATDLVVVGSPTYAGKLPNKILPDFREKLRGNAKSPSIRKSVILLKVETPSKKLLTPRLETKSELPSQ